MLSIADLDDFLAPSQVCIKPVNDNTPASDSTVPTLAKTSIEIGIDGNYFEKTGQNQAKPLQKAEITLNDCLACSGCITSAESVLVSMQSHQEVYQQLQNNPDLIPVVSISPQSIASLATANQIDMQTCLDRLRYFFKQHLNFCAVFDTTFARHIALLETQDEWHQRKSNNQTDKQAPILASACPGWVCYAEKTHGDLLQLISSVKSPQAMMGTLVKDWLAPKYFNTTARHDIYHVTVMPCYDKKLEASRHDFADPDGIRDVDCVLTTGEVLKMMQDASFSLSDPLSETGQKSEHETIFPELLTHYGSSSGSYLHSIIASLVMSTPPALLPSLQLETHVVRGADSVNYTLQMASSSKHTLDEQDASDSQVLNANASQVLFRGATCYGFRNLQNMVRKLSRPTGAAAALKARRAAIVRKRATPVAKTRTEDVPMDYIEVMACPSGCVNGGGQLPPQTSHKTVSMNKMYNGIELNQVDEEGLPFVNAEGALPVGKAWVSQVESTYWSTSSESHRDLAMAANVHPSIVPYLAHRTERHDQADALCRQIVQEFTATVDRSNVEARSMFLRTSYRALEPVEASGLAVKW